MRNLVVFFIGFLFGVVNLNADIPKHSPEFYEAIKPEVREAQRKGANAKIIYRVVDDEGMPITNTVVHGTWQNDYPRKMWKEEFNTDTNGVFVAKGRVGGRFTCQIDKEGYYSSCAGIDFHWRKGVSPLVKDGRWQPYGESKTIILKRVKKPINMKLLQHTWFRAPATNVWIGFDFECFSWTSPYGNGKNNDILVRFNYSAHNKYYTDWSKMDISFTNNSYAGFYKVKKDLYSDMKNPYLVDTNRIFIATNSYGTIKTKANILGSDSCLVFRTRTKVDENGRLLSAHYGVIHGPWTTEFGMEADAIFFNTNPNDINIEDLDASTRVRLKENGLLK